ncbi:hypothetical protein D3C73_719230 [compost metagenome]
MLRPHQAPGQVGADQADEPDSAAYGYTGRCQPYRSPEQTELFLGYCRAQPGGSLVAQIQYIHDSGLIDHIGQQNKNPGQQGQHELPAGSPDAARQPGGNKLVFIRIEAQGKHNHRCTHPGSNRYTGQQQPDRRNPLMPLIGKCINHCRRTCSPRKGHQRKHKDRCRSRCRIKGYQQHDHKPRSGIDSENAGVSQIIAENALHHCPRNRQTGSNQKRNHNPRQTEIEKNELLLIRSPAKQGVQQLQRRQTYVSCIHTDN